LLNFSSERTANFHHIYLARSANLPEGLYILFIFWSFQNNQHKLTLIMTPEEDYNEKCRDAEIRKLMDKVSALTPDERKNVFRTGNNS